MQQGGGHPRFYCNCRILSKEYLCHHLKVMLVALRTPRAATLKRGRGSATTTRLQCITDNSPPHPDHTVQQSAKKVSAAGSRPALRAPGPKPDEPIDLRRRPLPGKEARRRRGERAGTWMRLDPLTFGSMRTHAGFPLSAGEKLVY